MEKDQLDNLELMDQLHLGSRLESLVFRRSEMMEVREDRGVCSSVAKGGGGLNPPLLA